MYIWFLKPSIRNEDSWNYTLRKWITETEYHKLEAI